jgi:hypothetical protein
VNREPVRFRAVQNDVDASVWVVGMRGDPYPDGDAFIAGNKKIEGDASFRYGCAPPREESSHTPGPDTR